jgi:opacity protein-like surface antigen
VVFLVSATVLFCGSANAQIGKFGIGAHGASVGSATEEKREFEWGVHARARLSAFLALEGSLDFRSEELGDTKLNFYPIQVSALFYILPHSYAGIYGLIGLGWTRTTADGSLFSGEATNTDFGYHWGFGLEIPVARSSTVFVDARYLNLDLDLAKFFALDFDTKGWQLNFGFTFYF